VEFGLRFETPDDEDDDLPPEPNDRGEQDDDSDAPHDAEVVSLDSFRK
jgi:hypothetical protein